MTSRNTTAADVAAASANSEDDSRAAALVTMLRLRWFIRLRWVLLAAAVVVLVLERLIVGDVRRPLGLTVALSALAAVNLAWTTVSHFLFRRVRGSAALLPTGRRRLVVFANAQVAVDLLLLTCVLRFTGGVENPLAIFYLFHMAITALLLKGWQAVLQGVWAILLYTALVTGEWRKWFAPHWSLWPGRELGLYADLEFVAASLVAVTCGIAGTLYFTLHIARRLEARERQLRLANAALRQSQIAIEDVQRRRSRFMQTAAHQLKSPLAVIETLTDLIRKSIVSPEAIPKTCDRIVRRCREGIEQVSELLTLARVQEADPARHGRSEADVHEAISELRERFQPLAEEKKISLNCQMPPAEQLRLSVDPQDLSDCLGNLIDNAIKYTPGPGSVTITVSVDSPPGRPEEVSISVTDTGMGIGPDILKAADGEPGHEAVFDAFRRGDNVLEAGIPGTGLGLAIVREIVEQAGGRIRVTSRPNEGSSFTITFPAQRRGAEEPQVRDERASEVVLEPTRPDKTQDGSPDDDASH